MGASALLRKFLDALVDSSRCWSRVVSRARLSTLFGHCNASSGGLVLTASRVAHIAAVTAGSISTSGAPPPPPTHIFEAKLGCTPVHTLYKASSLVTPVKSTGPAIHVARSMIPSADRRANFARRTNSFTDDRVIA